MSQRCLAPEDLGRILDLPPDSAERLHLEACPRCRALLLTYREFLEDRSASPGADPLDAGVRLRSTFREVASSTPATGARPRATGRAGLPRILGWLREPGSFFGRRLVLVPAGALLLAAGLWAGYERFRPEAGSDPLRGVEPQGPPGLATISLLEVRSRGREGVELAWLPAAGADSYEVVVMSDDLVDLFRLSVAGETRRMLSWEELRPSPPAGAVLGWQVQGLRDGRVVARSPIGALRVP